MLIILPDGMNVVNRHECSLSVLNVRGDYARKEQRQGLASNAVLSAMVSRTKCSSQHIYRPINWED